MKPEGKGLWKGLSSISFIISAIVLGLGLDKMFNYENGESIPYEYHNTYVTPCLTAHPFRLVYFIMEPHIYRSEKYLK